MTGVRVRRGTDTHTLDTGLVLRSIGYRGKPVAGLPFDEVGGVIPNEFGRVDASPGCYVTGWIKRGPRGVIGTNRICAEETVNTLWHDHITGVLARDIAGTQSLRTLLQSSGVQPVNWAGWRAIDAAERERGATAARPRVKFIGIPEMRTTALGTP